MIGKRYAGLKEQFKHGVFLLFYFQISHRYLRARSIYLSDNLVAKVGDFDYAVLMEDGNSTADDLGWVSVERAW